MTVWIYVDTSKQIGDLDHLKVFESEDAANDWLKDMGAVMMRFGSNLPPRTDIGGRLRDVR